MTERPLAPEDFMPLIGSEFVASADGAADGLWLTDVEISSQVPPAGFRQPFSLFFDGTRTDLVICNMVDLDHPALGTIQVTPSAVRRTEAGGFRYQVVFS